MTDDRPPFDPAPGPAEADALNAALDGDASTPVEAVADLMAIAGQVRATPLAEGEIASNADLAALWDEIVVAASPRPTSVRSSQVVAFQALGTVPGRAGTSRGRSGGRTVASWLSMAAVAAVLIATASMAWSLRPGGGGDHLLASATSLAMGTAYASPSPVAREEWLRWPVPADCDAAVAPMSLADYATIMQTQPDSSGRSWAVVGTPSEADADAAADVARRQYACTVFGDRERARTLSSPAFTFFQSYSTARTLGDQEIRAAALHHSMLISATAPAKQPRAYAVILPDAPSDELQHANASGARSIVMAITWLPANAFLLADGRIAIPGTALYWKDDSWQPQQWQIDESDSFSTVLTILTRETGSWTVDESLTFCPYAGCSPTWERIAAQWQVPLPTLDVPVPWTIPNGTGTATPVASPAADRTATPSL
ncbi:MAG: hypothetical protein WBA46_11795 [Thermomicrobiales bacterium]